MKTIHVVCKREKRDALEIAREIIQRFGDRSSIVVEEEAAAQMGYGATFEMEHVGEGADLIVVLGGDGTLLSVSRHGKGQVPCKGQPWKPSFLISVTEEFMPLWKRSLRGFSISEDHARVRVNRKVTPSSISPSQRCRHLDAGRIIDIETYETRVPRPTRRTVS